MDIGEERPYYTIDPVEDPVPRETPREPDEVEREPAEPQRAE